MLRYLILAIVLVGVSRAATVTTPVTNTATTPEPVCDPPCADNGKCIGPNSCQCLKGWEGNFCERDVNECIDPDVCGRGGVGTCKNLPGSFRCECNKGFEHDAPPPLGAGDQYCVDINECEDNNGGCINMNCTNTPGRYRCACSEGYRLKTRKECVDIDECALGKCVNGHCNNTEGGFICVCKSGYRQDPTNYFNCIEINECTETPGICKQGTCYNAPPGYYACDCDPGYKMVDYGGGPYCVDFDECEEKIDGCEHNCENLGGTYRCNCNGGFENDPKDFRKCIDINECLVDNGSCVNAKCINGAGIFNCYCNVGHHSINGTHCIPDGSVG